MSFFQAVARGYVFLATMTVSNRGSELPAPLLWFLLWSTFLLAMFGWWDLGPCQWQAEDVIDFDARLHDISSEMENADSDT